MNVGGTRIALPECAAIGMGRLRDDAAAGGDGVLDEFPRQI